MTDRLDQLYAQYARLKPRVDELSADLKAITDAIKLELTVANPGKTRIDVVHPSLPRPLRLIYVKKWRLDTKRMKSEAPDTYAQYAVPDGRWELRSD